MKKCTNTAQCQYRDKNNPTLCGFKPHMTEYDVCPKIALNIMWFLEHQSKGEKDEKF